MNKFEDMSSTMLNSEHDYGKVKIDGETVVIAPNNYRRLMKNKDVKVRKKIYKSFNKVLDQYSSSNAQYLNSYVSMNNSIAKIRKFKRISKNIRIRTFSSVYGVDVFFL